tara:strand:+ start:31108 stop:31446 length:339 start_codon:yes stop_codon:yes gene_type:complete
MTWLDNAIEKAGEAIEVDVSHLHLGTDTLEVKPLSANEYGVLKSHPEMRSLSDADDRAERLGLLMIAHMLNKCDSSITWDKLKHLPLTTLAQLSQAITEAIGKPDGGGALGE